MAVSPAGVACLSAGKLFAFSDNEIEGSSVGLIAGVALSVFCLVFVVIMAAIFYFRFVTDFIYHYFSHDS